MQEGLQQWVVSSPLISLPLSDTRTKEQDMNHIFFKLSFKKKKHVYFKPLLKYLFNGSE